jgi:tetratricopeptide (TPR) repeat protein
MSSKVDGTKWNDYLIGAMRAFRLNDLDLAEKRLDKAFAAGGTSIPFLHLLAGHIAYARNALIEAEKSWRRVLEIDEDNAEAWNNLGVLYRRKGDVEKALDAFQEAGREHPTGPTYPTISAICKSPQANRRGRRRLQPVHRD